MSIPHRIHLSETDRRRLERHAAWFGLSLSPTPDGRYLLERQPAGANVPLHLSGRDAHIRLLAELCERTTPWICYYLGASCADVYLSQSDGKLRRIAELYALQAMRDCCSQASA
jgi:hypothetical protein